MPIPPSMANLFSANTSAEHLVTILADRAEQGGDTAPADRRRLAMAEDILIKAKAYSKANKFASGMAMLCVLASILWPVAALWLSQGGSAAGSAGVQTAIMTAGGLFAYLHATYKRRQTACENLLRELAFGAISLDDMAAKIIREMQNLDAGFDFKVHPQQGDPHAPA